jgi:hypothetical protein
MLNAIWMDAGRTCLGTLSTVGNGDCAVEIGSYGRMGYLVFVKEGDL